MIFRLFPNHGLVYLEGKIPGRQRLQIMKITIAGGLEPHQNGSRRPQAIGDHREPPKNNRNPRQPQQFSAFCLPLRVYGLKRCLLMGTTTKRICMRINCLNSVRDS